MIYYLEMFFHEQCLHLQSASSGKSIFSAREDVGIHRVCDWRINRDMYQKVGKDWLWIDRLSWCKQQWIRYAVHAEVSTYVATLTSKHNSQVFGYFELAKQPKNNVQIVYFGIVPRYTGKGLGSVLLQNAIAQSRQLCCKHTATPMCRLWLHTCSSDHPAAYKNYRNHGFVIYKTVKSY